MNIWMKDLIYQILLEIREKDTHKGIMKICVVAGSRGMTGAAMLCAESALRSGQDMCLCFLQQVY